MLIGLNILFLSTGLIAGLYLATELTKSTPAPDVPPRVGRSNRVKASADGASQGSRPTVATATIASRNLFSPSRSEIRPEAPPPPPSVPVSSPPPSVVGVVVDGAASVAYLRDAASKRVAGYRLGDKVADGTVETIAADHVRLRRPDGTLTLRLRDPARAGITTAQAVPVTAVPPGEPAPFRGAFAPPQNWSTLPVRSSPSP